MTYNLEEFKEWLEEDSSRKEGLEEKWKDIFKFRPDYFQGFIEGHQGTAHYFKPYREIVLKWIAERESKASPKIQTPILIW